MHVALLDVNMPGSGVAAARLIAALPQAPAVVAISAQSGAGVVEEMREEPAGRLRHQGTGRRLAAGPARGCVHGQWSSPPRGGRGAPGLMRPARA